MPLETEDSIQKVVDLALATGKVITQEPIHFTVLPDGYSVVDLEKFQYAEAPRLLKKELVVQDVDSFLKYYTLFQDEHSRIFCDGSKKTFKAVIDYHQPGDPPRPRWGNHTVALTLEASLEWSTWAAFNGTQKVQAEFAVLIEDNLRDIIRPAAAVMLETARHLKGKKDVDFGSSVKESNGSMMFSYSENISGRVGGGEIEVPEDFTLNIPIFKNEAPQEILCRLRYRITQEKRLVFWYVMARPAKMIEEALKAIINRIERDTKTDVLLATV